MKICTNTHTKNKLLRLLFKDYALTNRNGAIDNTSAIYRDIISQKQTPSQSRTIQTPMNTPPVLHS